MASLFRRKVAPKPKAKTAPFFTDHAPWIFTGADGRYGKEVELGHDYVDYYENFYKANPVVFACAQALSRPFSELRFMFQDFQDGRPGEYELGDGLDLLNEPWPGATTAQLNSQAILDYVCAGNAYVVKDRADKGKRLRFLRPDWVQIILNKPATETARADVIAYLYWPGGVQNMSNGVKPTVYTVDEVAHWMPDIDPAARWRGMSPLQPIVEEIIADSAATQHKRKFFENAATPSLMVMLRENMSEEEYLEVKAQVEDATGTDAAYDPMVVGGGADIKVVGADLKQVDFRGVQGVGETRIAAAIGVHPVLVPLSEGMQGSSLNAGNAAVAKDIMIDMTLRPLAASWASALARIIVPPKDVSGSATNRKRLWYDDRDVSFFRRNRKEQTEIMELEAGIIAKLLREGFTWDSLVDAVKASGDWMKLDHNGLISVQLWPPGEHPDQQADESEPDKQDSASGLARRSVNPNPGTPDTPTSTARKPKKTKPRSTQ